MAAALWGGGVTGTKYAVRALDPVILLSAELTAATISLWVVLLFSGYRPPSSWRVAVLLGLLEPALAYLGDTVGLAHTDAISGSLLSGLEAGLVVVLAAVLLGERVTRPSAAAVALALGGLVAIAWGGGRLSAIGDLCVTAGVLSASLYTIAAKRYDDGSDALALTTWQFSSATAASLSFATVRWAVTGHPAQMSAAPQYWLAAAIVGSFGLALSFVLYNAVLADVDAGWSAIVLNLIPVFGLVTAITLLGEHLSWRSSIGALLIGGSVIYFTIHHQRGTGGTIRRAAFRDWRRVSRN